MYHNFCIHSSTEEHLCSFQVLAIINRAAMNIVMHVSLLYVGASLEYMPRSGIAGSSGRTMFNFLRNRQIDFKSGCTSFFAFFFDIIIYQYKFHFPFLPLKESQMHLLLFHF